jgi:N-acetylglucosaminyl-diphospho-decaprenol L-rhamnosyltransferase
VSQPATPARAADRPPRYLDAQLSVDVAIVAYQRFDLTENCLRHLADQTLPHQVVLVDNGSTDGTTHKVREEFPHVAVIRLDRNTRYAIACNRAATAGTGEVIVMLNNDVDCRPDFLERLTAPLAADDRVGCASPLLLQPEEELIDSVGLVADMTLSAFPRFHGRPVAEADAASPTLTGPAGAAAAFRRAAWEAVGGLDEAIFAYMEDFDLALRIRSAGWKAAAALDAVAVHVGSATHGRRSVSQRYHGGFGRGYVLRRYGVLRSRAAGRALATEALVVIGDAFVSRDFAATRGRFAGWRAASGKPRRPRPPSEAVEREISFLDSIRLRRDTYLGRSAERSPADATVR